jgi:O-antigen ligase
MLWWQHLREAVLTQNPWFGLGFGLNLCVYNPFLVGTEDLQWVARSPHNINMTIFSRMGLVGVALWFIILAIGLGRLLVRAWDGATGGRAYTPARREELLFWLVMLLTTWINSSFGVLMEGPVLGIWFWFALGFASGRSLQPGTGTQVEERRYRIMQELARRFRTLSDEAHAARVWQ